MTPDEEARLDAAARAAGLALTPQSRAGVALNLAVLARMAATFEAAPLDPHEDPLPVFRP